MKPYNKIYINSRTIILYRLVPEKETNFKRLKKVAY